MNYRAEIDGLRAIAVVSVILYHAQIVIFGRDWFEGGFIGVDIFFVISGYLITRIILTELEQNNTFSFIKFYERRARRILPMLLVVIAVCIPFAWQRLLPLDLIDFAKSALSAIGFGSNFFFYFSNVDYGANSALLKPLLHTWSLGVEEQFYVIIPITILIIWKFARTSLLTLLIGMLITSIQFANIMEVKNSELNFFLPFSRFWELLVGSAIAFIELKYGRSKNPILTQTLPIIGLFLIIHCILFFDSKFPHPSFQTLIPIIGVALILVFCSTEDLVGKILSFKPIVGVGLISYSLYLWHFPIFAFGRIGSSNPSTYDKIEWISLAFIISMISYYLIEKIFRNSNIISTKSFLSVMLISTFLLVYVSYDFILKEGYKDRLPSILWAENVGFDGLKLKKNGVKCHDRRSLFCSFNSQNEKSIFLIGDSHLSSISEKFILHAKDYQIHLRNYSACPPILNLNRNKQCNHIENEKRFNWDELNNSIIIIGGRFPLYLEKTWFDNKEGGVERIDDWGELISDRGLSLKEEVSNTINHLISNRNKVVLLYPIPEVGVNVQKFIFNSIKGKSVSDTISDFKPLTTSYDVYKKRSASTFELFDSIQSPNIYRVYPHTLFCDKQIKDRCVTHDNNDIYYVDDDHPSAKGSEMIVELIMKEIKKVEANIRGN